MNSQFFKNISTYIILIVPIILFGQKYNYSAKVDVNMDINQAIQMLLNHGITGLILLILGWWYYKRQASWDKESAEMRKELMTYVKDDQESDYKFIQKLDQLCDEVSRLRDEVQHLKK